MQQVEKKKEKKREEKRKKEKRKKGSVEKKFINKTKEKNFSVKFNHYVEYFKNCSWSKVPTRRQGQLQEHIQETYVDTHIHYLYYTLFRQHLFYMYHFCHDLYNVIFNTNYFTILILENFRKIIVEKNKQTIVQYSIKCNRMKFWYWSNSLHQSVSLPHHTCHDFLFFSLFLFSYIRWI